MYCDLVYGISGDTQEKKPTANLREYSRIAFFLRRRALLRLIAYAESHAVWKNAVGKTRVRVFLSLGRNIYIIQISFIGVYDPPPFKFPLFSKIYENSKFDSGCFQIIDELRLILFY